MIVSQAVRLAVAADVGRLFLFHHDPEHGDRDIELKLEKDQNLANMLGSSLHCAIAAEGESYSLTQPLKALAD